MSLDMANQKPKRKLASAKRHHPEPQHSSAPRRRLSLGFSTLISVVPLRKATPQQESYLRATTAPSPIRLLLSQDISSPQVTERQIPNPQIRLSSLVEPQDSCPYDQTKCHSFSSIERSRCTFCGMRSSRPRSSEPCKDCRSKSPFSHIRLGFRPKSMSASSKVKSPSPEYLQRYSCSSDERPRIVPPEIAAKRIGNPPRRVSLPVPRQGAINNIFNPPPNHPASHSAKQGSGPCSESALESQQVRATSPKLHHLHGLPDSKAYPYVHKKDVQQHFAALRAGASSPLEDFANAVQEKEQNQSIDFSETIYYGRTPKPALISDVYQPIPKQARRREVFVEHTVVVGGHVLTERSRSERRCSVNEQSYSSPVLARRSPVRPTQQPRVERVSNEGEDHGTAFIGKKSHKNSSSTVRTSSDDENTLRPRGGGGDDAYSPGCGFLFKQLLLTCSRSRRDMTDMSSNDGDDPPRIPDPVQIARTKRRAQGTARLPKHILRGCGPQAISRTMIVSASNSDAEVIPLPRRATFAPTYKPPRPLICRIPTFTRSSVSRPTAKPYTQDSFINAGNRTTQSATSITPCLRGGASSPSTFRDDQNLPPTILWLAGGDRRKPMRTASWKAQRPTTRRDGLLGCAVHGLQAGKVYEKVNRKSGSGEEKDGSVVRKEGCEVGGSDGKQVGSLEEGKKDEGSSTEGNSSGVSKNEVVEPKEDAAVNSVPKFAEADGGGDPEQGDEK